MNQPAKIVLGVIGGSGLYEMDGIENIRLIEVDTPFGKPSTPVTTGTLEGLPVGFIARHGEGHTLTPTEVNYRANIYALKYLGAGKLLSISACGSLREDYAPGDLVVPDQLVDFTKKRPNSFFNDGLVAHVGVENPFCPDFSAQLYEAAAKTDAPVRMGGSAITIEGPRFSTKAESQLYRSWGIDLIGMTTAPEAFLAKEAELCYSVLFHVTDYDVWHQTEAPVSVDQVFEIIQQNTGHAKDIIRSLAQNFTPERSCNCGQALEHAFATSLSSAPEETKQRLSLLIDKYLKRQ